MSYLGARQIGRDFKGEGGSIESKNYPNEYTDYYVEVF